MRHLKIISKHPTSYTFWRKLYCIYDNAGGMATDIHNGNEMGLGIYMCVELVKKHGGDITYQNVNDGLKVTITFLTQTIP